MKWFSIAAVLLLPCLAAVASAAGFVHDESFMVFTGNQGTQEEQDAYAQQVLEMAHQYRAEIAREWLGEEIPAGIGRTVINVAFSETDDSALTWAIDCPERKMHNVYLTTTSAEEALGGLLHHEITHVVLATRFPHPHRLPAWVEEGIASRYDDAERVATRDQIISWSARTGNWPDLAQLLAAGSISAENQDDYAAAASLVSYLLTRAGSDVLLQFAQDGRADGWNAALQQHYGIANVATLQSSWQVWAENFGSVASN